MDWDAHWAGVGYVRVECDTGSCAPGKSGRTIVARRGVARSVLLGGRGVAVSRGSERSGPSRPTGGPLLAPCVLGTVGPLTVSLCVPTELAGPPESVVGAVPRPGVTSGYMNWCVICRSGGGSPNRPNGACWTRPSHRRGTNVPPLRQLCLKSRRRKPRVVPPGAPTLPLLRRASRCPERSRPGAG
jgi:hypothetical protein